jgi:urease accessory protein
VVAPDRIVGVETGTCPHSAVREDPSGNLLAIEELESRFPDADWLFVESGGDNLTLTFSPALADLSIYVIDVAGGEKIPRKRGPGLIQADLLVINKTDLADLVGARLPVMESDSNEVRDGRPTIFTNCKTGEGIDAVLAWLDEAAQSLSPATSPARGVAVVAHD